MVAGSSRIWKTRAAVQKFSNPNSTPAISPASHTLTPIHRGSGGWGRNGCPHTDAYLLPGERRSTRAIAFLLSHAAHAWPQPSVGAPVPFSRSHVARVPPPLCGGPSLQSVLQTDLQRTTKPALHCCQPTSFRHHPTGNSPARKQYESPTQ